MSFRTDRNNNPAAFTTDVAKNAGLQLNVDYCIGDKFPDPSNLYTAKLLGDPLAITIRVINNIGYYTKTGQPRWTYIAIPKFIWDEASFDAKKKVIQFHYQHEGGTELNHLWTQDIGIHVGDGMTFGDKVG